MVAYRHGLRAKEALLLLANQFYQLIMATMKRQNDNLYY
jgi:hypothetical protein